jgi:hypothetical protein
MDGEDLVERVDVMARIGVVVRDRGVDRLVAILIIKCVQETVKNGQVRDRDLAKSVTDYHFESGPKYYMFFDLNVPVTSSTSSGQTSKKGKGKQLQIPSPVLYTAAQINTIEARVDCLLHCQSNSF